MTRFKAVAAKIKKLKNHHKYALWRHVSNTLGVTDSRPPPPFELYVRLTRKYVGRYTEKTGATRNNVETGF